MKRFLLPLIAALALPTTINANEKVYLDKKRPLFLEVFSGFTKWSVSLFPLFQ